MGVRTRDLDVLFFFFLFLYGMRWKDRMEVWGRKSWGPEMLEDVGFESLRILGFCMGLGFD